MPLTSAYTQVRPETFSQQNPVGRLENSPHLVKKALKLAYKQGNEHDRATLHAALARLYAAVNDSRLPYQFQHSHIAQRVLQYLDNDDLKNLALTSTGLRRLTEQSRSTIFCGSEDLDASIRNSPRAVNVFIEGASTPQQLQTLQRLPNIQILTLVDGATTLDALGASDPSVSQLPTTLRALIVTGAHHATELPTPILDGLSHLNSLTLEGLPNLTQLPDRKPGQLQHLVVRDCPQLTTLPDWCADLISLDARGCTALERLPNAVRDQMILSRLNQHGDNVTPLATGSNLLDIRVDPRVEPDVGDMVDFVANIIAQGPVLPPLDDAH